LQCFIELIRFHKTDEALSYAQKELSTFASHSNVVDTLRISHREQVADSVNEAILRSIHQDSIETKNSASSDSSVVSVNGKSPIVRLVQQLVVVKELLAQEYPSKYSRWKLESFMTDNHSSSGTSLPNDSLSNVSDMNNVSLDKMEL